jgi:hypothetical protein
MNALAIALIVTMRCDKKPIAIARVEFS